MPIVFFSLFGLFFILGAKKVADHPLKEGQTLEGEIKKSRYFGIGLIIVGIIFQLLLNGIK